MKKTIHNNLWQRSFLKVGQKNSAGKTTALSLSAITVFFCLGFLGFSIGDSPTGLIFSHKRHLGRGFSCAVCHQFYSQKDPVRPPERLCKFCHEIGDHEQPTMECTKCHTRKNFSAQSPLRETFDDTKFRHEIHLKRNLTCEQCHGNLEKAKDYGGIDFPDMDNCSLCHEKRSAGIDCKTCHVKKRKDRKPESHMKLWLQTHGRRAVDIYDSNCAYCHSQKVFCQGCHMAEPPGTHSLFFKNRGHGFWASIDRLECLPCHQQDFCLRCHGPEGEVMPPSHKGGFLDRRPYLHCARCHFPAGEASGCRACHRAGIIQAKHLEATEIKSRPIPSFVPGISLNCLNACHPFDRVLPLHPLGGLMNNDCIRCHVPEGGL